MNYGSCVSSIYCLVFDPTRSGGDVNKTVPFELAGKRATEVFTIAVTGIHVILALGSDVVRTLEIPSTDE